MRFACWILWALAALAFIGSVYSKFMGPDGFLLGFFPVAWWRASTGLAILAIGLKLIHADGGGWRSGDRTGSAWRSSGGRWPA